MTKDTKARMFDLLCEFGSPSFPLSIVIDDNGKYLLNIRLHPQCDDVGISIDNTYADDRECDVRTGDIEFAGAWLIRMAELHRNMNDNYDEISSTK